MGAQKQTHPHLFTFFSQHLGNLWKNGFCLRVAFFYTLTENQTLCKVQPRGGKGRETEGEIEGEYKKRLYGPRKIEENNCLREGGHNKMQIPKWERGV